MKAQGRFESAFLAHCRQRKFFRPGGRVLIAVSGGLDSMAMLHVFVAVREQLGIELAVAHVDHGLRGSRSTADSRFVQTSAKALGLKCHTVRIDLRRRARRLKESLEEAGRHARYEFFDRLAARYGYDHVCTAHHADDQSETVLTRLIKGTGWKGLSGVRETRGVYVRPLLPFRRSELERFVADRRIRFRDDHTNLDTGFLRNRIRHKLLPLLREHFDPRIDRHLGQLAQIAGDMYQRQEDHANRLFTRLCRHRGDKIVLEIKPLRRYLFVRNQALYGLIFEKLRVDRTLTFSDYDRLNQLITGAQSGRRLLIGHVECLRLTDTVVFRPYVRESPSSFRFPLTRNCRKVWPDRNFGLEISQSQWNGSHRLRLGRHRNVEYVDADAVRGHLIVRSWKPGDSFFPLGMGHRKKLSDFFSDEKVPLTIRKQIPVLCARFGRSEHIVWICGHRIDDRCKVTTTTTNVLRLAYTREGTDD